MFLRNILKLTSISISSILFIACGGGGGSTDPTELDVTINLPSAINSSLLSSGSLTVYISETGSANTPDIMTLNGATASYSLGSINTGLSGSSVSYDILVELNSSQYQNVFTLATSTKNVKLTIGEVNSLIFNGTDFVTTYDEDADTKENIDEVLTGTNPFVPICVLGTSTLDNCELDS